MYWVEGGIRGLDELNRFQVIYTLELITEGDPCIYGGSAVTFVRTGQILNP